MSASVKFHPASKSRITKSFIAIAIILGCMYFVIFHTQGYSSDKIFPVVVGGNSLIFLVGIWVDDNSLNVWKRLILSSCVLVVFILSCIGVLKLKGIYHAYELREYGQSAIGEVKAVYTPDFEWFDGHAVVRYTFNDQNYIQRIEDNDGKYSMGDQLQLTLSSRNPEIVKVIGQKQN